MLTYKYANNGTILQFYHFWQVCVTHIPRKNDNVFKNLQIYVFVVNLGLMTSYKDG